MEFEWDEKKNAINLEKHGLAFEDIVGVFKGDTVTIRSNYANEPRVITTGEFYGALVTIVSTQRDAKTRIISARKASREEKERYSHRFAQ